ncbi:MAG TPA: hypothetical protein VEF89_02710 [Solirubrobacteraceae bacterium]|nr:hypothetical protein [Solirubrobacteraceae bacterium]
MEAEPFGIKVVITEPEAQHRVGDIAVEKLRAASADLREEPGSACQDK